MQKAEGKRARGDGQTRRVQQPSLPSLSPPRVCEAHLFIANREWDSAAGISGGWAGRRGVHRGGVKVM